MAASLLEELREHLEDIENYLLALAVIILIYTVCARATWVEVYFYTRH
jgi:hypothetical protein